MNISDERQRIRPVVRAFSVYVLLMLFQTSYRHLGTITSAGAIILIFIVYMVSESSSICLTKEGLVLLPFMSLSLVVSVFYGFHQTTLRYIAQILLFFLMSGLELSEREVAFLKKMFVISTVFYAILIVRSKLINPTLIIHSNIQLFGVRFDTNYIGLPLVVTLGLTLAEIFRNKNRIWNIAAFFLVAITIFYSASRGTFLSATVVCLLIAVHYLFRRNTTVFKKIGILVLGVLLVVCIFYLASKFFPEQWARMLSLGGEGSDNGRLKIWGDSWELFLRSPIWGNGLGSTYRELGVVNHNTYLEVLTDTGIIGFILFLAFLARILKNTFKVDRTLFYVLVAILCQIFFLNTLDNRILWLVLTIAGMLENRLYYDKVK